MTIYALDPGPVRSHLVELHDNGHPIEARSLDNGSMLQLLSRPVVGNAYLVIEQIEGNGMPVGAEVFETCFWSGRFAEAWDAHGRWTRLGRRAVKLAMCGSSRANDATIRQALIDRYGPGKSSAVGTKANPGPLYGIRSDLWQALALAVTFQGYCGQEENIQADHRQGA